MVYNNNLISINLLFIYQRFQTVFGNNITVNILEMNIEPRAEGRIEIYDGYNVNLNKRIANFQIINGTLPQGHYKL